MQRFKTLILSVAFVLAGIDRAIAATELQLKNDSGQVRNYELTAGTVKAVINYDPIKVGASAELQENNLRYQLFYKGVPKVTAQITTYYVGSVALKDIDNNGTPEVIVTSFSGGAHCCTTTLIYTWQNDQFKKISTGFLDGMGGDFQDLNDDGTLEFVSYDQSFLYRFSSYAGSFPPSKIYSLKSGRLVDTTRQYPKTLESVAWRMYQSIQERKRDPESEINGVLAGYVAQKALLGAFDQGWQFMLANYDRKSDWGLEILDKDGKTIGRYPDFPAALKAHLKQAGYIK